MSNITMVKVDSKPYFQFSYISLGVHEKREFVSELVYSLNYQVDILVEGYKKIIDFLYKKNLQEYSGVKEKIIDELQSNIKILKEKKHPIMNEMLKELDNKSINESSISLLMEIIDYQTKVLQKILDREINEERLDVCISYLSEHLYYLQYDLELKELPIVAAPSKVEGIKLNKRFNVTVTSNYDSNFNEIYMKKGA